MAFIFMKSLPDEIRVHRLTGIRLDHPTDHWHQECYECLLGNPQHVEDDWDAGVRVRLTEFLKDGAH